MKDFRKYVRKLYGSQKQMAQALDVSENTVSAWVKKNPYPMLRHAGKIIRECNTTHVELNSEVIAHAGALNRSGAN